MKQTRAELLWKFQVFLEARNVIDPDRRDRLSGLFLERGLSRATELDFVAWLKGKHFNKRPVIMRTRGSRLAFFSSWLNQYRPFANREERERLTRLYHNKQIARDIERDFHRYLRDKQQSARALEMVTTYNSLETMR